MTTHRTEEKMTNFKSLETIHTAINELSHCVTAGPDWFTNGRSGQASHAYMWTERASEALKFLIRNKSPRLTKKLKEQEQERQRAKMRY